MASLTDVEERVVLVLVQRTGRITRVKMDIANASRHARTVASRMDAMVRALLVLVQRTGQIISAITDSANASRHAKGKNAAIPMDARENVQMGSVPRDKRVWVTNVLQNHVLRHVVQIQNAEILMDV